MGQIKDITGEKFGRLTVVDYAGNKNGRAMWRCSCECGSEFITNGKDLRMGKVKSCGCSRREHCSERMKKINYKHGLRGDRLYHVWRDMKMRVLTPKHKSFSAYGGRGITICGEWLVFENFYKWAMSNGYDPLASFGKCTLDRIDVNGNYEPDNCRFVDMKVQANNRRKSALSGAEL